MEGLACADAGAVLIFLPGEMPCLRRRRCGALFLPGRRPCLRSRRCGAFVFLWVQYIENDYARESRCDAVCGVPGPLLEEMSSLTHTQESSGDHSPHLLRKRIKEMEARKYQVLYKCCTSVGPQVLDPKCWTPSVGPQVLYRVVPQVLEPKCWNQVLYKWCTSVVPQVLYKCCTKCCTSVGPQREKCK